MALILWGPSAFAVDPRPTFPQGVQGVATSPWYVNLRNASGTELGVLAAPVRTDPTGTTPQPASQSGAWTAGRTWTLLNSTDSVNAVQSGTWTVQQGTPPWSVSQSGTWTVQQGTPPWSVGGTVAHAAADSGNPVKVGGKYNLTPPSLTDGNRSDLQVDKAGRLRVVNTVKSGGVFGNLSVGTSAVEVKVGGSRLVGRHYVGFLPFDADMFWCPTCTGCTTSTGMPVFKSQYLEIDADDTADICLIASSTSKNARIQELP